jgi:hypothetical protein
MDISDKSHSRQFGRNQAEFKATSPMNVTIAEGESWAACYFERGICDVPELCQTGSFRTNPKTLVSL